MTHNTYVLVGVVMAKYAEFGGDITDPDELIPLADPTATAEDIASIRGWVASLIAERRRIDSLGSYWTGPPEEPDQRRGNDRRQGVTTDPPSNRGRRVIRKSEPMGG